jgi:glycosyltransferase involved in cell wall biosynthesis
MAAMEGQVMGLPVIAPDFGPFTYIVSHGVNGMLFETGSVQSLKRCISNLLADSQLYARLRTGAEDAGRALVVPPLTFGAAVQKAFS